MPAVFVEDTSAIALLMSCIFTLVGVFLVSFGSAYTIVLIIMGVVFILIGLAVLSGVVKMTVTINELSNRLIVHKTRLYCFESETSYDLNSVMGAELQSKQGRRQMVYRIVVHTTTHGVLPMSYGWNNVGIDAKTNFVNGFNTYLSSIRGGAPIIIPGNTGAVSVTVVTAGQQAPLLGAQIGTGMPQPQYSYAQPQRGNQTGYNPMPVAGSGQPQQQQQVYTYAQYQQMPVGVMAGQQQNMPVPTQVVTTAASNPYAVQPSAPPPYNPAMAQQRTY